MQHAPSRCFFPDPLPNGVNLLTVPSCADHNHGIKNIEDDFRAHVLGSAGVNQIGTQILWSKLISPTGRKNRPWKNLVRNASDVEMEADGVLRRTVLLKLPVETGDVFLTLLTRALVYKLYRHRWSPALYFCMRPITGPAAHIPSRDLFERYVHGSRLFVVGHVFACNHMELAAHGKWLSMWVYTFYDAAQYLVLCTDTAGPEYLDG